MELIYGIDIGGTFIKIGKFVSNNNMPVLIEKYEIKTIINNNPLKIINQICDFVNDNLKEDTLSGIGVCVPGPVLNGKVLGAQNILWEEVNLKEILQKKYPKIVITIANDANAALYGEWKYSNYKDVTSAVLITLGTGVGGGIVINNKLLQGENGSAGELGHIKIFPFNGRICTCGRSGCLETYVSATGIVREALEQKKGKLTTLNNYSKLTSKIIFDCAKEKDYVASSVVDNVAYFLAIGISNICDIIDPKLIIIGGGVSKAGDFLIDKVKKHFEKLVFYSIKKVEIKCAELYNDAGIYGCYYMINEELSNIK